MSGTPEPYFDARAPGAWKSVERVEARKSSRYFRRSVTPRSAGQEERKIDGRAGCYDDRSPARRATCRDFRRDNGTYGFQEWNDDAEDGAWLPNGKYSVAVADTAERAEAEAGDAFHGSGPIGSTSGSGQSRSPHQSGDEDALLRRLRRSVSPRLAQTATDRTGDRSRATRIWVPQP